MKVRSVEIGNAYGKPIMPEIKQAPSNTAMVFLDTDPESGVQFNFQGEFNCFWTRSFCDGHFLQSTVNYDGKPGVFYSENCNTGNYIKITVG